MSARKIYQLASVVSRVVSELNVEGVRIEVGDNFAEYRRLRNSQPERSALYPMFDVSCSFIDASNGFWIAGFNAQNEVVHTQAVRLLDLTGSNLGEHMSAHRHKYITPETTPDPDETFFSGPQALERITGKVCYHGDFWIKAKELGGPRGRGLTPLLSRIAFEVAFGTWEPDFFFGLMPRQFAMKGLHYRYGYFHCEPGRWHGPDKQVTDEECLSWMSASDVANVLSSEPEFLRAPASDAEPAVAALLRSVDLKP
jgi:hypothetical protein